MERDELVGRLESLGAPGSIEAPEALRAAVRRRGRRRTAGLAGVATACVGLLAGAWVWIGTRGGAGGGLEREAIAAGDPPAWSVASLSGIVESGGVEALPLGSGGAWSGRIARAGDAWATERVAWLVE